MMTAQLRDSIDMSEQENAADIAVIGLACRFPGANSAREYWDLLREGREARTELSDAALRAAGVAEALRNDPNYVKAGMFLQGTELFDAGFFGFSPLDARIMDPQHRHFLECAWEALEDAAYDPGRYDGAIGVFAGSGHNAYLPYNLLTNPELVAEVGFFLLRHTGNDKDFLATRASYCFDLKGPSVNVQTACSTSLVAVHTAAQSLITGECDIALAGGVTIELPHQQGYLYKDSEILSRDGHCRPFDASAGGTVFGSGVGVLVLKRLDDALADGDHIHALLKSSAINNDGAGKVSYLAPSVDGQAAAIHEALAVGDVDPASVSYVECHGTGTPLGDPIEVAALTQAYGAPNSNPNSPQRQYCGIGSVKSNIGHLDTAAGAASLIKVILAMQHRQLPATLHYRAPNAAIDFAASPFYVNAELRDWIGPTPLRAGVSSLGVGGTNAHIIVQEAPARPQTAAGRTHQLLLLSARSEQSLLRSRERFARFFEDEGAAIQIADAAYTLAVGRRAFRKRGFAVVENAADAVAALENHARFHSAEAPDTEREVAFMFAGGGAQYPNMGRDLYTQEPAFRAAVDECLQHLRALVDFDLKPLLYPEPGREREAESELERPSRTLPALFVTQYAQAQLWRSWGVEPAALIGHSMGENTAACIAGVISLRDALGLVALRGRLFETVAAGSMMSVELGEQELLPLLGSELSLGAINAPQLSMVSGPKAALATLEAELTAREIGCRRIRIEVAAHSQMLDGILQPFGDYLRSIRLSAPTIPFISNLSGDWISPEQATNPDYWVKHLRHTVRFADGVAKLLETDRYALLEVGPGRTLTSLASSHGSKRPGQMLTTSLPHPDEDTPDLAHMLGALGHLWQAHVEIDWGKFYGDQQRLRVALPTYAFDHARHWIEPGKTQGANNGRREQVGEWLYQPTWQRAAAFPVAAFPDTVLKDLRVLVLQGGDAQAETIARALHSAGADVRTIKIGAVFDLRNLRIRVAHADDYVHLVEELRQAQWQPTHVLNLLPLDAEGVDLAQRPLVFDSLFHFAQAAANEDWQPLRWLTLARQSLQVGGEALRSPLAALALGALRVLPREFPEWQCTLLDIDADTPAAAVLNALNSTTESLEALRGSKRYVQRYRERTDAQTSARVSIRENGAYLVTGGTGGLGLVAAVALAERQPTIDLYLMARRGFPAREYWAALIAADAPEKSAMQQLIRLEQNGARVSIIAADVADEASLRNVAEKISTPLRGIVHTAGTIADALLLNKDFSDAETVLRPKVDGLLVLDRVFDLSALDFVALYSSTSAFFGLPGQIDYAAANAFEDAFAHWLGEKGVNCVAINWPAWRNAGMAAAIANGARHLPAGRPTAHALLDRCIFENAERATYATLFNPEQHWLLSEHRIASGPALIPGSGFIELARAAWAERNSSSNNSNNTNGSFAIRDAVFELPFFVADRTHKALTIEISGDRFTLTSDSFGDASVHARGIIESATPVTETLDIAAIRARCNGRAQRFDDADHHPFLAFGPRWRVLQNVACGNREALIRLDMPQQFRGELDTLLLHPALLDMATAGAQAIIDNYNAPTDLYVPVSYRHLQCNGALPATGYSLVMLKAQTSDEIQFDVRVCNDAGAVMLRIDGFAMRRIPDIKSFRNALPAAAAETDPALVRTLELGIDNREGAAVLLHILEHGLGPQTAVSPYPLDFLRHELLKPYQPEPKHVEVAHDADADPEIEAIEIALRECAALAHITVRSFASESEARRLVAFFVPDFDHFSTQAELRRYARDNLPVAQVPQQWVELDEMPLVGDGNIDRKALADPFAPQNNYAAPRTTVEKALARIWQDALGAERVGLTDNFFDLGGHSLLSTRVIVQIYKKFGVRLDQATMVLHTLEQVAREVAEKAQLDSAAEAAGTNAAVAAQAPATEGDDNGNKKKGLFKTLFGTK